jgi:hypothetical protein
MKKMGFIAGMAAAGVVGLTTYVLVNKNTKNKADKLINNFLDKANDMTNDIMN